MKRVAFVISRGLFYLSIGATQIWPLAWLAPIPLLVIALAATTTSRRSRSLPPAVWEVAVVGEQRPPARSS